MASPSINIEQTIAMYFEADRSSVRARYEELFSPSEMASAEVAASESDAEDEQDGTSSTSAAIAPQIPDLDQELVELKLADAISARIRQRWEQLEVPAQEIALHHLWCAGRESWTIQYQLEGLMNLFGCWCATHILHPIYPGAIFPIDADQRYHVLKKAINLFGIEFDDGKELLPSEIGLEIGLAIGDFQSKHKLEDWQMWALIYDLAPRLLPPPAPYPLESNVWVTCAVHKQDLESIQNHASTDQDTWSMNKKAKRGDLALMYVLAPQSSIVAVYRCAADAYRDPFHNEYNGIWTEITDKLDLPPLTIKEMKADAVLKDWPLVRNNFRNPLRQQVSSRLWERIKELCVKKQPELGTVLEQYATAAKGIVDIKWIDEKFSEREFEDRFVVPLVEKLGWQIDKTVQRQFEMVIKIGSGRSKHVFADFVGFKDQLTTEARIVIESKKRIRNDDHLKSAVEQCESYAGKLRCSRFAVAAPEGIWVYDLSFPGQSSLLAHFQIVEQLDQECFDNFHA